jgi:hypothetical protein
VTVRTGNALRASTVASLSAVNPAAAKAAMLYTVGRSAWNAGADGDVDSSTSWLIAAENLAAVVHAAASRHHATPLDPGETS